MSIRDNYSDDEWRVILQGPTLATLWVIQAGHYSQHETQLKLHAGTAAMFEPADTVGAGELAGAVIAALLSGECPAELPGQPHSLDAARRIVLAACRRVAALLAQKTPHPAAAAYIAWLLGIAHQAAAAGAADQTAAQAVTQLEAVLWSG